MFDCDKIEENYLSFYFSGKNYNSYNNESNRRISLSDKYGSRKLQSNDNKSNIISDESNLNIYKKIQRYNRFDRNDISKKRFIQD
jgi:hypothetical protein